MKIFIRTALLAAMLLASVSALDAQVSVGIRIGPPPHPRVVRVQPAQPGPGFVWVDGYWYPDGRRYRWHDGYWTRHRMRAPAGLHRITMGNNSLWVTGRAITDDWNTIIVGTMIATAITEIMTETKTTATIKTVGNV